MKVHVAALSIAWIAILGACSQVTTEEQAYDGPSGQLRVSLTGGTPLVTLAIRNVFDQSQVYLIDCMQKDHLLDGGVFCDELIVLPPGVYEIIVQSQDPNCHSERDHYKVIVREEETVEIMITLVCEGDNGGLDVIVVTRNRPIITKITFGFDTGPANKFICQGPEDVRVEVSVQDDDTACAALVESWKAVNPAGVDVTATFLSAFQEVPGSPCRFSALIDASFPLGTYQLTFTVTDPEGQTSHVTFPVHIIPCPTCGNGTTEPPEQCDDGNTNNYDGCRNNCTVPFCGDGIMDPGEQCDDGNNSNTDYCKNDCTLAVCGDGVVGPGEQCDDGNLNDNDGCKSDCTFGVCGDGVVGPGEQCDDGNTNNNDYCKNNCTLAICGDGVVGPGEQCDDGNTNDTDGCRNNCTLPLCGNGVVNPGEQCDDGNTNNNDSCKNDCTLAVCGDGVVGPGEQCDDGNFNEYDGCRNNCTLPLCGNGQVDPGEQCDDGNSIDNDGCRNNCTLPVCGDGVVNPGEQCDDGNFNNYDGCRNNCTFPVCGDGIKDPNEQCDDGNTNNNDYCKNNCTYAICGDGVVGPGEQCDDGNLNNYDGCRNNCTLPTCGDGVVNPGEQCDDGNLNNFDACRNNCTLPYCGDGIVDPGEQCDDGNTNNNDGCSNTCTTAVCGLTVDKTCQVLTPPVQDYTCTKPIDSISLIWGGTGAVRINAWKGTVGGSTLLASMRLVQPGELVTVTGYAGSPNDVYWEVFDATSGAKIGTSTFHLSCSDDDMDGAEDCGKAAGDGKAKVGYLNTWIFAGWSGGGVTLDCGFGNGGFPTDQSCTIVPVPGPSCETLGKPQSLTFEYTGEACDPTGNLQGSKAACTSSGTLPNNVSLVFLKDATKFTVSPSTNLTLGQTFTISTVSGGDFPSEILVALQGGGAQQSLKIHTSCSAPLRVGDSFGGLTLVGFNGVTGGTEVVYGYRVTNAGAPLTNVTITDSVLGPVAGPINLASGETKEFTLSASLDQTTTNVATVQGTLTTGGVCQDTDSVTVTTSAPQGSCTDGKPTRLTFEYNGGGCSTTNPQSGKFICSGFGPTSGTVQVVVTQDASKIGVSPSTVGVDGTFDVYRSDSLGSELPADTYLAIQQNGVTVQSIKIHTSCSQPLHVGDVFGSLTLVGFTPKN